MSKLSLMDKLKIFFEVSKSSSLYLIVIILLLIIGYVLLTTDKKTLKRNKTIYLIVSIFILLFIIVMYHGSLSKIFDHMMNNFFIAVLFPNIAIYLAAIIITNIIVWISIFSFKTDKWIKRLNITIYVLMNYLLTLILSIINTNKLDVFSQEAIYGNKQITALIELSSTIFIVWIIFLSLYKIILIYLKKEYKPKVKKVFVKKEVKKLPEDYNPVIVPDYVMGRAKPKKTKSKDKKEDLFTKDEYKVMLKLLKEERLKKQKVKENSKIKELRELYKSVK